MWYIDSHALLFPSPTLRNPTHLPHLQSPRLPGNSLWLLPLQPSTLLRFQFCTIWEKPNPEQAHLSSALSISDSTAEQCWRKSYSRANWAKRNPRRPTYDQPSALPRQPTFIYCPLSHMKTSDLFHCFKLLPFCLMSPGCWISPSTSQENGIPSTCRGPPLSFSASPSGGNSSPCLSPNTAPMLWTPGLCLEHPPLTRSLHSSVTGLFNPYLSHQHQTHSVLSLY